MVVYSKKELDGIEFNYTKSDQELRIRDLSDNRIYDEALYPIHQDRSFVETDERIISDENY